MLTDLTGLCCYVLAQQMRRASILDGLFDAFHGMQGTSRAPYVHRCESLDTYFARCYDGPPDFDELLEHLLLRVEWRGVRRKHKRRVFLPFLAYSAPPVA